LSALGPKPYPAKNVKGAITIAGVLLAGIVALPLLVVIAASARFLGLAIVPLGILALLLSPRFRAWLSLSLEGDHRAIEYSGPFHASGGDEPNVVVTPR